MEIAQSDMNWIACLIRIYSCELTIALASHCSHRNDDMAGFRGWRLFGLAGTIFIYVTGILLLSIISLQNSSQRRPRIRSLNEVSARYLLHIHYIL